MDASFINKLKSQRIAKRLCALLAVMLLLPVLCACSNGNEDGNNEDTTPKLPDTIFGDWHPMPDISEEPAKINADGTCVIHGEQWTWVTKTIEEDTVTLTVGEGEDQFDIEFLYLNTNVPIMADKYSGWSVKQKEVWNYTGNWYNEDEKDSFTLSLFAMKEAGCEIVLESGKMIVKVPEGDVITHTLEVTAEQCVVTDAEGNSTTYHRSEWEI